MEKRATGDMARIVAEKTGMTIKDTKTAINGYVDALQECILNGDEIQILGLGTFKQSVVPAKSEREGIINPRNGARGILAPVPEHNKLRFAVSSKFKKDLKERTSK